MGENSVRAEAARGFDGSLACRRSCCLCSGEADAMHEGFVYVMLGGVTMQSLAVFVAASDVGRVRHLPVGACIE